MDSKPSIGVDVISPGDHAEDGPQNLDLTGVEPSADGGITVTREVVRERSTLTFGIHIFKLVTFDFSYDVNGQRAGAAPLCAMVILAAILASCLIPRLILPPDTAVATRLILAAVAGGSVLAAGTFDVIQLLRHKH